MVQNPIYNDIKKATVAIVLFHPERMPECPFTIIGSGFCVHEKGLIVTCEHVFKSFFNQEDHQKAMNKKDGEISGLRGSVPTVIFFGTEPMGKEILVFSVPVTDAVAVKGYDLALLKVPVHKEFSKGYPILKIAEYSELHETMEIGTCGFPLGNILQQQLGTITSSFTKGMISSIIPAPHIQKEYLKGFQLDLTATNGNSGGPVFSLSNGHVLGVLQGGAVHPDDGRPVQGITKAEPIYPLLENNLFERLLNGIKLPKTA